jgi:hypothetical protein
VAKLTGDPVDMLKGKKPRPGGKHHYKRGKDGTLLVQANPAAHKPSGVESAWISNFSCLARFTKAPWSGDFNNATELQDQTGWYWRDVIHSALSGKLLGDPAKRVTTPTARVFRTGVEALTNGVVKILTPNDLVWDNNVFWNPIANQSRLTIRSQGVYLLGAQVEFSNTNSGRRAAQLIVNGSTIIGDQTVTQASANLQRLTPVTLWAFNQGDYVEVGAFANVAGASAEVEAFWIVAITPEGVI